MPSASVASSGGASVAVLVVFAVCIVVIVTVCIGEREMGPRPKATVVRRDVDVVVAVCKGGKIVVALDEGRHVLEVVVGLRRLGRVGKLI